MTDKGGDVIIAVAHLEEKAQRIAELCELTGNKCTATTDLGWALDEGPRLLLIDPDAWRTTVHALLSGYDTRAAAPPAVLLVCGDGEVLYEVGPAVEAIRLDKDAEELRELITRLTTMQTNFARIWPEQLEVVDEAEVARLAHMVEQTIGIEIRSDRRDTFLSAVRDRMVAKLCCTLKEYTQRLHGERGKRELLLLSSRLVVGETYFWRYSGQMNALKLLLDRRRESGRDKQVRIWCAGCSTGEEVYSVLMAALEVLGEEADVHVFGTDLHPLHLLRAKRGIYSERTLRNLPQRLRQRWFTAKGGRQVIKEELKGRVSFIQQNLFGEKLGKWVAQSGPFDSVFCRNVTIYFDAVRTRELLKLFYSTLKSGGGLFLGSAETIMPPLPGLEIVHETGAFYYMKAPEVKAQPSAPTSAQPPAPTAARPEEPGNLWTLYREGLEELGREDFEGARRRFTKILDLAPDSSMGMTGMAILLANQGREIEARELLGKVIAGGDALAEAHFMLGLLDERAGKGEEALESYAHTLAYDPTFFMAHFNRAWILKRQGRTGEFAAEMKGALAILKGSANCPVWATGGLGLEAILGLVAEAVHEETEERD